MDNRLPETRDEDASVCLHHNDKEQAACPVCLVATLTAEMKRLKRDYDYNHRCLHEVRERCESWKQRAEKAGKQFRILKETLDHVTNMYDCAMIRAERAEADLDQVACARTDGILRESDLQCTLNMERKQFNKVKTALNDAISTYFGDDKLVTAERIEAWQAALKEATE